jgi:hypothetical protein
MPPEAPAPVEPAPMPPPPDPGERWDEATRAMIARSERICSRMTRLKAAHPAADLDTMEDSDVRGQKPRAWGCDVLTRGPTPGGLDVIRFGHAEPASD